MGTLFQQQPRNHFYVKYDDLRDIAVMIKQLANELHMSVAAVTEIYKIKTYNRFIDCYVDNGDIFDEQMAGFGELLRSLNEIIESFSSSSDEK